MVESSFSFFANLRIAFLTLQEFLIEKKVHLSAFLTHFWNTRFVLIQVKVILSLKDLR